MKLETTKCAFLQTRSAKGCLNGSFAYCYNIIHVLVQQRLYVGILTFSKLMYRIYTILGTYQLIFVLGTDKKKKKKKKKKTYTISVMKFLNSKKIQNTR